MRLRDFLSSLFATAFICQAIDPALAGTCALSQTVKTTGMPTLTGQLAFEATLNGNIHVFYFDFAHPSTPVAEIDAPLAVAENPNFSPDGKWIVFYGNPSVCSTGSQTIYAYNIAMKKISTLITCNPNTYQDIRFLPDQSGVIYKMATSKTSRNIVYAPIALNANTGTAMLGSYCYITNDGTQHSAPSASGTGKYIYYYNSPNPSGSPIGVYRSPFNPSCSPLPATQKVTAASNDAYYPVARDETIVFYARHAPNAVFNGASNDQIFSIMPDTDTPTAENQLSLNNCYLNNNDPAPVDENDIIFSRGTGSAETLYLGDIGSGSIWALAPLLTTKLAISNLRGATYTKNR